MAVIVDTDSAGRVVRMYYEEDKMTIEKRAKEKTPAQIAAENGWEPGAILIHHQTSADLEFEITAIGVEVVVGRRATIPPASGYSRREFLLSLDDGRWSLAKSAPAPQIALASEMETENIKLQSAVEEEREDKRRLRDALEVYANKDNWYSDNGDWANVFDDRSAMDGWGIAESALEPETDHDKRVVEVLRAENLWMRDRLAEANGQTAEANKRAEAWRIAVEEEREAYAKIVRQVKEARRLLNQPDGELAAQLIEANIRARSAASPADTEGEKE